MDGIALRIIRIMPEFAFFTSHCACSKFHTEEHMSKECAMCGKTPQGGNHVSHSNIKTKRRFHPNLQKVRHQHSNGQVVSLMVCTRCIRSGAVVKPATAKS